MRKRMIFAVTFLGGLFFVCLFFFGGLHPKLFGDAEKAVLNVLAVVATFAVGMSLVSIASVHGKRLIYKRKNWPYSLALFLGLGFAIAAGLGHHYFGEKDSGVLHGLFQGIVFRALIVPLSTSMFSLLAFYMVSASYRAFRLRSAEAGLMMAAALVVMLAQMPVIQQVAPFSVGFRQWILETINTGAQRAILIGSGLAMLIVGLRMWLGVERGTFFEQH